jgi:radical SAM superfamily enzyme YgiQ (UPF0313 family)
MGLADRFASFFENGTHEPPANGGVRFVLTASAAEMATYDNSWMKAMMNTFPQALVRPLLGRYLRPVDEPDGTARFAPYGLRKVESILAAEYGAENVVVVHPANLDRFVGPKTQVVALSTMDPLGLAYVSMTYNPLIRFGGESLDQAEFIRLMQHPVFARFPVKKVVGGFGVWQIDQAHLQDALGIDLLITGECEEHLIPIMDKLLRGESLPKYVRTSRLRDYDRVPLIRHAAGFGTVEITRGCGRRCQFCSPDYRTKYDFPIEHVIQEVEANVRAGCDACFIATEDIFLYGQHENFVPNRQKIGNLLRAIAAHPAVHQIAISHASITPVLVDRQLLPEITPIILEKSHYRRNGDPFVGVDVGIESGSVHVMRRYMGGKALPYRIEQWPEIVVQGTGIMNDHRWYPMFTFIMGLPNEREDDVLATLELFDRLRDQLIFYVPLLFVPLEEAVLRNAKRATVERLSELHWEFLLGCWRRNLRTWAVDIDPFVRAIALFVYSAYLQRVHGPRSFRPMMKFVGLPGLRSPGMVTWKRCDYEYCFGDREPREKTLLPLIHA